MGKLSTPLIFIGYSGKTFSLPSFSLMSNTKSLLAPLKEEEINVSVSGPKKMNVPFTFSHSSSLAGDFKKAETYLKFQESIFYTRGVDLRCVWWQESTWKYLLCVWGSKQTSQFTAGEWCQVCRSMEEANHPWADQRHHISLFQGKGNGKRKGKQIKGWRERGNPSHMEDT